MRSFACASFATPVTVPKPHKPHVVYARCQRTNILELVYKLAVPTAACIQVGCTDRCLHTSWLYRPLKAARRIVIYGSTNTCIFPLTIKAKLMITL